MTEITSLEQFNDIVKAFKDSIENPLTNCFLMPEEIRFLISQKRLFVKQCNDWLVLICNRDDYSNFYYYTSESSSPSSLEELFTEIEKNDIYIDIVSRFGNGDLTTPENLISQGYAEKYKTYQRMQLFLKDVEANISSAKLPEGYSLSFDYCDYDALLNLWKLTLDEKSTPLPQKEELLQLCKEKKLLSVLYKENELAGVVVLSASSKQGLLQHLAVAINHRRKGLALYLVKALLSKAIECNLKAIKLWVDCDNSSAIALYDRLNFKPDGMLCEQLYMKGK